MTILNTTTLMHYQKKLPRFLRFCDPKTILLIAKHNIWLIILLLFITSLFGTFNSNIFSISTILCTYNERPCRSEIEIELSQIKGKNILVFRDQPLIDKLHKADVTINEITVAHKLPNTISVTMVGRNKSITIAAATDSAQLIVDDQLMPYAIEATKSAEAKIISSHATNIVLGRQITDPLLSKAVLLAQVLDNYFVPFRTIIAEDYHLEVNLANGTQAIFPTDGNFPQLVTSLQLILRESTIQPPPSEVDLRFAKPVFR